MTMNSMARSLPNVSYAHFRIERISLTAAIPLLQIKTRVMTVWPPFLRTKSATALDGATSSELPPSKLRVLVLAMVGRGTARALRGGADCCAGSQSLLRQSCAKRGKHGSGNGHRASRFDSLPACVGGSGQGGREGDWVWPMITTSRRAGLECKNGRSKRSVCPRCSDGVGSDTRGRG